MRLVGVAHGALIHSRRVNALSECIFPLLEGVQTVADVGCGDGQLAMTLARRSASLKLTGFDVHPREHSDFPIQLFDGKRLPLEDSSVDAVLLVDVLHHAESPSALLAEAFRVARHRIVIKDHLNDRPLSQYVLAAMDWVGNKAHGVASPGNYWSERAWRQAWLELGLNVEQYKTELGLYPWVLKPFFEKGLHFVASLSKS